jgi:hypothetical protein
MIMERFTGVLKKLQRASLAIHIHHSWNTLENSEPATVWQIGYLTGWILNLHNGRLVEYQDMKTFS